MNKTLIQASTVLAVALLGAASTQAIATPAAPQTASAPTVTLTVAVEHVRLGRGPIMMAVFDSETGWRGAAQAVRLARIDAASNVVTTTFQGLPPGTYAIKLYQDLNADGALGLNFLGIPTEPYGFSNNAPVRFGPPSWAAARFTASTPTVSHTISLPE
jgi:uncharacterized protein (DUF2141 family)